MNRYFKFNYKIDETLYLPQLTSLPKPNSKMGQCQSIPQMEKEPPKPSLGASPPTFVARSQEDVEIELPLEDTEHGSTHGEDHAVKYTMASSPKTVATDLFVRPPNLSTCTFTPYCQHVLSSPIICLQFRRESA